MTDRYYIVTHDRQRFDHRYAVIDGHSAHARPILQTNNFARALEYRNELNSNAAYLDMLDARARERMAIRGKP
jgi:hypothetical protein